MIGEKDGALRYKVENIGHFVSESYPYPHDSPCSAECIDLFCKCGCHDAEVIITKADYLILQHAKLAELIRNRKKNNQEIKIIQDYIKRTESSDK